MTTVAGVVADANVLLSAVVGKAAGRVIHEFRIPVHVASFNAGEVAEYLPRMAVKYRLPIHLVELAWHLLPFTLHPFEHYSDAFAAAQLALSARDPEDAHPLALARTLGLPLWSNDGDLQDQGVECFTTARLLKRLGG